MIDTHSHILPGIDDGAKTIADSVEMVRELVNQGVSDIVLTPHYMDETIYTHPKSKNKLLLNQLRQALKYEDVDVRLYLGNEIYITDKIQQLIWNDEISAMAGGKYLLIELPMTGEFPGYEDIFIDLMKAGYQVMLAHPERYHAMQDDYDKLTELYNIGVLFQSNIGSILGQYGKHAKKTMQKLANDRLIFSLGTDIHHCKGDGYIGAAKKKLMKYYDEQELKQIMEDNPQKVLKG